MIRALLHFSELSAVALAWVVFLAVPLGASGLVSTESVYEGFRTQQRIKDAGSQAAPEGLGSYDAYQKEREKAKSAPVSVDMP